MFYVLTPPEKTTWHIGREELVEMLRRDWPQVEVELGGPTSPTARDVIWSVRVNEEELEGSQDHAGQAQYLEGSVEAVAGFATWWRRQVPALQPLILCDETYSIVVNVEPDMSAAELISMLAQP